MDKFKIAAFNCQGLKEKYENPDFVNKVKSYMIFGVNETWLNSTEKSINVPGYKFYPLCRKKEKRGQQGVE